MAGLDAQISGHAAPGPPAPAAPAPRPGLSGLQPTWEVGPVAHQPLGLVEHGVQDDVAQVGGAHLVDLWVSEGEADAGAVPWLVHRAKLIAHVAHRPLQGQHGGAPMDQSLHLALQAVDMNATELLTCGLFEASCMPFVGRHWLEWCQLPTSHFIADANQPHHTCSWSHSALGMP